MRETNEIGSPYVKRWFTRKQAARTLGVSVQAWHRIEKRAGIKPVPVSEAKGWKPRPGSGRQPLEVIRAEDVARLRDDAHVVRMSHGQLSASAFEAFERGHSIVEVVMRLKISPEQAEQMHVAWRRCKGLVMLPASVVEHLHRMGFDVRDEPTMLEAVQRLLNAARRGFARAG